MDWNQRKAHCISYPRHFDAGTAGARVVCILSTEGCTVIVRSSTAKTIAVMNDCTVPSWEYEFIACKALGGDDDVQPVRVELRSITITF